MNRTELGEILRPSSQRALWRNQVGITHPSVYLAGLAPVFDTSAWREEAIDHFLPRGIDVFIPGPALDYTLKEEQQAWEAWALHEATTILFWLDQNPDAPTSVRRLITLGRILGHPEKSKHLVYGFAPKMAGPALPVNEHIQEAHLPIVRDLHQACEFAAFSTCVAARHAGLSEVRF